jgi:hypothetical protein
VVHFIVPVHGVITATSGVKRIAAGLDRIQHRLSFLPLPKPTTVSRYVSVIIRDCGENVARLQQLVSARDRLKRLGELPVDIN